MDRSTPVSVVLGFVRQIDAGDLNGIAERTPPKYRFTDMSGDVRIVAGERAIKESWNGYLSAYPGHRVLVRRVLRSGDSVAMVDQATGSHLSAEDEHEEPVLWIDKPEDGFVSEWRIY